VALLRRADIGFTLGDVTVFLCPTLPADVSATVVAAELVCALGHAAAIGAIVGLPARAIVGIAIDAVLLLLVAVVLAIDLVVLVVQLPGALRVADVEEHLGPGVGVAAIVGVGRAEVERAVVEAVTEGTGEAIATRASAQVVTTGLPSTIGCTADAIEAGEVVVAWGVVATRALHARARLGGVPGVGLTGVRIRHVRVVSVRLHDVGIGPIGFHDVWELTVRLRRVAR
jgi:hypothetical protein